MCRQLLLELDNALRLLHDDGGTQFLGQVLTLNLDLLATTFAARLEKVGAATLHGCDKSMNRVSNVRYVNHFTYSIHGY